MEVKKELEDLYPDLIEMGGLAKAIDSSLHKLGSCLVSKENNFEVNFVVYARFEREKRFSQIYVAAHERLFMGDIWQDGIQLGNAVTDSLKGIANFLHDFLEMNMNIFEIQKKYELVRLNEKAKAFEDDKEIEWQWESLKNYIPKDFPELVPFFELASKNQIINQLFPYTSLNYFCLSRCTGYPFTNDCPSVVAKLKNGKELDYYEVRSKGNRKIGKGNAEEVLQIVLDSLPENCERAVRGTAEDFIE